MIIIPLSLLLDRGVALETDEAVAIVQSLVSSSGVPTLENVEIDTAGGARCRNTRGQPSVAALAAVLHRLLPARNVVAGLRYTVARGLGVVEAPPFSSVDDFSRALSRFEQRDRAAVIRGLISRARPAPPPPRAALPTEGRTRRSSVRPAFYVAAALSMSALAGFDLQLVRLDRLAPRGVAAPTLIPPSLTLLDYGVTPLGVPVTLSSPDVFASPAPPPTAGETPYRNPAPITVRPVRALPAAETPAFSPAFSSAGTALFFQTGGRHDPSSAIAVAGWQGGRRPTCES